MSVCFEPVSPKTADEARAVILAGLTERFGTLRPEFLADVMGLPESYAVPRLLLVGLEGSEVVCTGALLPEGENVWRVQRMSVRLDMRRRGLGRATLAALEAAARARTARRLVLETTADWHSARHLYEAEGFTFLHLERQQFPNGGGNTVAHYSKELT